LQVATRAWLLWRQLAYQGTITWQLMQVSGAEDR
jgi:hypothetical protein